MRSDIINSESEIEKEELVEVKFHGEKSILKITKHIKEHGEEMKDQIIIFFRYHLICFTKKIKISYIRFLYLLSYNNKYEFQSLYPSSPGQCRK